MRQTSGFGGCLVGGCLRSVLRLILVPVALVSGIFLFSNVNRVLSHDSVEAVVVDLIGSTGSDGDPVYQPVYEYTVDGETYRYTSAVSLGGSLVPELGERRTLLYDPDNPGNARVRNWFLLLILPGLGVLIPLLILLALGWAAVRRSRREEALPAPDPETPMPSVEPVPAPSPGPEMDRQPVEAVFMGVEASQMDAEGNVRYRVRATADIDGVEQRFLGDWLDEDPTLLLMEHGNRLTVMVDTDDPTSYEVRIPEAD